MQTKLVKTLVKKSYAVKLEFWEAKKRLAWAFLYVIFQDRHKEPYGLLENVYVEKEYRSLGLGTKLTGLAIKEAKKRKCYKLIGTSKFTNTGAHRFYERFGLKKIGYEFRIDFKKSKPLTRD
jgi:GNAT superfamily N-acetyltransferase